MFRALLFLCLAFPFLRLPATAQFIAVTFTGDVLNIDPNTGTGSLVFSTGVQGLQGMTISPGGRFWCIQRWGATSPKLCELDTVLQKGSSFYPTFINEPTGLAFNSIGYLYVVDLVGSSRSRLWAIDFTQSTGSAAQLVGEVKIGNQFMQVTGLTFSPNGTLYGWAISRGLLTIDPFTAQAVDVDGNMSHAEQIHGLAWAPDGFLYGGYDDFYRIDPVSGVSTQIGGPVGFGGLRGLEHYDFLPPTVYCSTKRNSTGCLPAISVQGSSSFSGPDDLVISASRVLPQKPGLLFWGSVPQQTPFGGGSLCVQAPLRRTGAQVAGGSIPCSGTYAYGFTQAYMTSNGLQAGDWFYAQWWSRDQGFSPPKNIGLTDAIAIQILP